MVAALECALECRSQLLRIMHALGGSAKTFGKAHEIGIGEVAGQHRIVVAQGGTEQDRAQSVDGEIQMRKVARVAVIQPLRTARSGDCIPAMIEDREAVPMFQRARPALMKRCRRRYEELGLLL
jgi:hypothetical protein